MEFSGCIFHAAGFFIIKTQILKKEFALLLVAEAGLEHATSRL